MNKEAHDHTRNTCPKCESVQNCKCRSRQPRTETADLCYKCRAKVGSSDKIPGGLSDGMSPSDFDSKALSKGIKVELEHTSDKEIAQEIAMDHLAEDIKYYDKLEVMEASGLKEATPVELYSPWGPVDNVEQVRYPKNKKEKKEMSKSNSEDGSIMNEIENLRARGASVLTNLEETNPQYKKYNDAMTYLNRIADGIKESNVEEKKDISKPLEGTIQSDLDKEHIADVKKWDLDKYNNSYVASEIVAIAKNLLED